MFEGRISYLNNSSNNNSDIVLYYPINSFRLNYNHTLAFALKLCVENDKKLKIMLKPNEYMNYNKKQLEMIQDTFGLFSMFEKYNSEQCYAVVTDKPFLKEEYQKVEEINRKFKTRVIIVETNLVVPIEEISLKEEYGAYTIRKKIMSKVDYFSEKIFEYQKYKNIEIKNVISPSVINFFDKKIKGYEEFSSSPDYDFESGFSKELALGILSPIELYLCAKNKEANKFIEQLVVRRTLAYNFVYYNKEYDTLDSLPDWSRLTLFKHKNDKRPYVYSSLEMENLTTHDIFFNAAMNELKITGNMNGHMRMYWGKKIIEWVETHSKALEIMIYLNNKYAVDGNTPNTYASILWCFGKHDRPFFEREIFGKVRYMNEAGLKRKYKMERYLQKYGGI